VFPGDWLVLQQARGPAIFEGFGYDAGSGGIAPMGEFYPNAMGRWLPLARGCYWHVAPVAWHEDSPEALLTESELRECLETTLVSLPEEAELICNLPGLSLSNVRVLLHRARLEVFASIEHFEETGEC
jgi:hypothetical protein